MAELRGIAEVILDVADADVPRLSLAVPEFALLSVAHDVLDGAGFEEGAAVGLPLIPHRVLLRSHLRAICDADLFQDVGQVHALLAVVGGRRGSVLGGLAVLVPSLVFPSFRQARLQFRACVAHFDAIIIRIIVKAAELFEFGATSA